jgi:hypothetical protein
MYQAKIGLAVLDSSADRAQVFSSARQFSKQIDGIVVVENAGETVKLYVAGRAQRSESAALRAMRAGNA